MQVNPDAIMVIKSTILVGYTANIREKIHYYNTQRVQRNLGVLTPMEKHRLSLAS